MRNQNQNMISYFQHNSLAWDVFLDGKKVGKIVRTDPDLSLLKTQPAVSAGYTYFPNGKKVGGQTFNSLTACKNSLEAE